MMDMGHVQFPQEPPTLIMHSQERRIKALVKWQKSHKGVDDIWMHPVNEFMGFDIIICHHNRYKSRLKFLKNDTKAVEFYDIVWLFSPQRHQMVIFHLQDKFLNHMWIYLSFIRSGKDWLGFSLAGGLYFIAILALSTLKTLRFIWASKSLLTHHLTLLQWGLTVQDQRERDVNVGGCREKTRWENKNT